MAIELESGGARAVILPAYGGRLHQLFVPVAGQPEPLLHSPDDIEQYRERPTRGGSFPMAPWPNRVANGRFRWNGRDVELPTEGRPHAIHGRVKDKEWEVVARTARVVELVARFDDGWPWPGRAWQRFELTDTSLRMKFEVRAEREAFPAGCGWHPWFRRDVAGSPDAALRVPAGKRYVSESDIPTGELVAPTGDFDLRELTPLGERRIDTCYTALSGPVTIRWERLELEMAIACPFPHVQVFTPGYAFCVEPQSCAPDAFNLAVRGSQTDGMGIAAPGRPVSIETRWTWSER
ncbi:MAG: aldose 1-epimerase [Hyphomicrobiales bacterium]